ncbi:GntR family transcriptional regulator [Haloechinothrix sp. YIM 98757]|uniref:GntR family transcriptional regulator n=1 Tax=Haloechinothrix aidingensis TaxID=2752311 RepID=A0A837ZW53_9PSEU|nr:GntR family transcriptional regulator [Haloechinothrix aidingensis]MBA0124334.1 GntR family transcriptional regulator [Haloechinothrix aidingensis]
MPEIQEVLPKYLQIANYLRDEIIRGDRLPGSEVPSEREIAADWNVARPTASKALDALRQQGFVESRRGSGTYVRELRTSPRARERLERAKQHGTMYSDHESVEFLKTEVVDGPAHVTDALAIAAGSRVIERKRLIKNDSAGPIELSTSWFPSTLAERAPRLLELSRIHGGTGAYIGSITGRSPAYARDQVCARLASPEERRLLRLPDPAAVLVYWLSVYDADDSPIQFDEAVYPQDRWSFRQEYPIAQ